MDVLCTISRLAKLIFGFFNFVFFSLIVKCVFCISYLVINVGRLTGRIERGWTERALKTGRRMSYGTLAGAYGTGTGYSGTRLRTTIP